MMNECIWAFSGVWPTQIPEAGKTYPRAESLTLLAECVWSVGGVLHQHMTVCRARRAISISCASGLASCFTYVVGDTCYGNGKPVQIGWWCLETQIVHNSSSFCLIYCVKVEDILCSVWAISWRPMCVRTIWTLLPSLTTFGSPRLHHKRR